MYGLLSFALVSPRNASAQAVGSVDLINSDTGEVLSPFTDGMVIDFASLPTRNLNLRVNTIPTQIGSVRFDYDGNSYYRVEDRVPYAIGSNDGPDYLDWTPSLGDHTLTIVPYSDADAQGTTGPAQTYTFTVIDSSVDSSMGVTGFTLIDAESNSALQPIVDGATIDLSQYSTKYFSIRADTTPARIGSVRFGYDGVARTHVENIAPYAIAGDVAGDYWPFKLTVGSHTVSATGYSLQRLRGNRLASDMVAFNVIDGSGPVQAQPLSQPAPTATPTPLPPPPPPVIQKSAQVAVSAPVSSPGVAYDPAELFGVIRNPNMGWESTDMVNSAGQDSQGFPNTIAYYKFYWKDLEPSRGVYDWNAIDRAVSRARSSGQKLAFRVVTSDNLQNGPQWLRDAGASGYVYSTPKDGGTANRWTPSFDDPNVLREHSNFLAALGGRYNGSPDIASVDIGSVGLWGEWHFWETSPQVPMPTLATKKAIINKYLEVFDSTPLAAQIIDKDGFAYATSNGTGWRGDCLGNVHDEMNQQYPQAIAYAGADDAWQNGPVLFEACWNIARWISMGNNVHSIFQWALDHHATGFDNKNNPVPASAVGDAQWFMEHMGYRFVAREIRHPSSVPAGARFTLAVDWENIGVAPCYGHYRFAVQFRDESGNAVWTYVTPFVVKDWMPGTFTISQALTLPPSIGSGTYTVALGIVDSSGQPKVQLANRGQDGSGWYPFTQITVQ
jgi:hypothetical protein